MGDNGVYLTRTLDPWQIFAKTHCTAFKWSGRTAAAFKTTGSNNGKDHFMHAARAQTHTHADTTTQTRTRAAHVLNLWWQSLFHFKAPSPRLSGSGQVREMVARWDHDVPPTQHGQVFHPFLVEAFKT